MSGYKGMKTGLALLFISGFLALCSPVWAENVSMKVVVANTTEEKQEKVPIQQDLPREIKKDDILETGSLQVRYDEERARFYLYGETDLDPKTNKEFKVVIRDVWKIPESDINFMKEQTEQRLEGLKGKENYAIGRNFRDKIVAQIDEIATTQEAQKGDIEKRMEGYRLARKKIEDVRQKVIVADDFVKEAQRYADVQKENKFIKFIIEAKNPSETEPAENVEITRYIPEGIQPDQITDTQGFEIKFDPEKNLYYLISTINFKPGETKKFEIIISDVWRIPESNLDQLQSMTSLTTKLTGTGYEKIGAYLTLEINKYVEEIKDEQNRAVIPEDKISAYTVNLKKVEAIEKDIEQLRRLVEMADKAKAKKLNEIIKTVTPDVRTTWQIIYAAIAFLTIISVFFYFLWWGQAKSKQNQKMEIMQTPDKEK